MIGIERRTKEEAAHELAALIQRQGFISDDALAAAFLAFLAEGQREDTVKWGGDISRLLKPGPTLRDRAPILAHKLRDAVRRMATSAQADAEVLEARVIVAEVAQVLADSPR